MSPELPGPGPVRRDDDGKPLAIPEGGYTLMPARAKAGRSGAKAPRRFLVAGALAAAFVAAGLALWWAHGRAPAAALAPVEIGMPAEPERKAEYVGVFRGLADPARGVHAILDGEDRGWIAVEAIGTGEAAPVRPSVPDAGGEDRGWAHMLRLPMPDPARRHLLTLIAPLAGGESRGTYEYEPSRRTWRTVEKATVGPAGGAPAAWALPVVREDRGEAPRPAARPPVQAAAEPARPEPALPAAEAEPDRRLYYRHTFMNLIRPERGIRVHLDGRDLRWIPLVPNLPSGAQQAALAKAGAALRKLPFGRPALAVDDLGYLLQFRFGDPAKVHRVVLEYQGSAGDERQTMEYDPARASWHVARMEQRQGRGWIGSDFGYDPATGNTTTGAVGVYRAY